MSLSTIKSRIFYSRKRLKQLLSNFARLIKI
ncbi:hypothetical protein NXX78_01995 [Bacteroides fragilis]|nr:hypothetical protein [Bacteroides fragilis]